MEKFKEKAISKDGNVKLAATQKRANQRYSFHEDKLFVDFIAEKIAYKKLWKDMADKNVGGDRQHCRLSICENWLSWTNTVSVSERKIPITILILKRGPCLGGDRSWQSMKLRFHRKLIKQIKATEETFGLTEDEIDLFINRVDNDGEGSEESSGSEGEKEEEEREMDNIKSLVEVDEDDLEEDNSDAEEEEEEVDQIPGTRILINF